MSRAPTAAWPHSRQRSSGSGASCSGWTRKAHSCTVCWRASPHRSNYRLVTPRPDPVGGLGAAGGGPDPSTDASLRKVAAIPETAAEAGSATAVRAGAGAQAVALGILLSRISGLLRDAVFSRYFGPTLRAD